MEHLTANNLHSQLQSAYKQQHSTETALLKVKNDILMSMNAQHVTLLILLDLKAAFDTIHHDKLIGRLESDLGITDNALAWFKSYLCDRFQRVAVNGSLSDQFLLKQGVPQGSCLGPLLFTIYTRTLFQILERHLPQVHCHAADTPSSETQAQIVGTRKSLNGRKNIYGTKKSKERREEPLGTKSYHTSSKRSPPFWLLIGARKTQVFWHQSQARTAATVWNWSGKTLSPGALLAVLYFSSFHIYFSARLGFPSPPLSAPGSPRMPIHSCMYHSPPIDLGMLILSSSP